MVLRDQVGSQQNPLTTTSFSVRFASTRFANGSAQKIRLTVSYLLLKYSANGSIKEDRKVVNNIVHEYDFVPYNAGLVNATAEHDLNNVFVVYETNIVPTASRAVSSLIAGALPTVNHQVTPSARTMDDKMRKLTANMPAGQKGLLELFRESTFYGMCSHGILSGSNCVGLRSSRSDNMLWSEISNAIGTIQNRTVPFPNLVILYACKGGSGSTASDNFKTVQAGRATVGFDQSVHHALLNPSQGNLDAHAQVLIDSLLAGYPVEVAIAKANLEKRAKNSNSGLRIDMVPSGGWQKADRWTRLRYVYITGPELQSLGLSQPIEYLYDFFIVPISSSGQ